MLRHLPLFLLIATTTTACASERDQLIAEGKKPTPPSFSHRDIVKPTTEPAGDQIDIIDGAYKTVLFVPPAFKLPADGHVDLAVHFHGGVWFPLEEHLRRGLTGPLLICQFGEGSSVYGKPFIDDPDRFGRFLTGVEAALDKRGGNSAAHAKVAQVDITSFSAGYGSVREILKQDKYIAIIRRVILADSLYAGWDPATTQPGATSQPAMENMQPFVKFVELAAAGKKTFVFAHSHVPTTYANTQATAAWIIDHVHAPNAIIHKGDTPAADDDRYPLVARADIGHLHIWDYEGEDAQAHMTSARHIAELWEAMDACGDR